MFAFTRPDWWDEAKCSGALISDQAGSATLWPGRPGVRDNKVYDACPTCPVALECMGTGIVHGEWYEGTWGGVHGARLKKVATGEVDPPPWIDREKLKSWIVRHQTRG